MTGVQRTKQRQSASKPDCQGDSRTGKGRYERRAAVNQNLGNGLYKPDEIAPKGMTWNRSLGVCVLQPTMFRRYSLPSDK